MSKLDGKVESQQDFPGQLDERKLFANRNLFLKQKTWTTKQRRVNEQHVYHQKPIPTLLPRVQN
jgi:hypothetical protein